ncbi:hypothetical protein [Compostimonas suwonensis]|uniref:Uncharacterized protein n=1 Tax=Compostimonas suwonensis TaxID=1048394 RepID=A0A2M9BZI8_9MICO|nr:hypothetical protein [Compostimonas suwonensis]PJJ63501.1 hypothetical protein CLV54_1169 [Compostimonas suwonensis]
MQPQAVIESYVGDVIRHLPRAQRNDVGFELRSLLNEELAGRAADAGRPADAPMTMELLTAFGRPQDVADRYRPAGFTIIRPADAPQFAWLALGGVVLQWAITLPVAFLEPARVDDWAYGAAEWWGRLTIWWLSWGLGSFWWPGILIVFTLIAALIGRRRRESKPWTPPRVTDRDLVSRTGIVLALAFGLAGATLLIALPWLAAWAPGLPQPVLDAFAFDPGFLTWRAPWVLLLWAASFALLTAALIAGRWSRRTRGLSLLADLGWLALLIWWIAAGPIFTTEAADSTTKLCLALVAVFVVIDIVVTLRRGPAAIRPPATAPRG